MDDELDIQPWPVLELVGRAVALTSVAKRGMLEVDEEDDVFSQETDRFELSTWARTELSNWITDTEYGAGHLLARVIVNRVWQHHLGQGIVSTENDFGKQAATMIRRVLIMKPLLDPNTKN